MKPPEAPTATSCSAASLRTASAPDQLAPKAGSYTYKISGQRKVLGDDGKSQPLPSQSEYLTTIARDFGNIRCFAVQRRFTDSLADTATFAIRGADVYLTQLDVQSGGQFTSVHPGPPALSFSGSEAEWSGSFRGPTSARYRAEIVGRRKIKVGSRRVEAVGVKSEFAFAGEIEGSETSTRWISTDDNVVLTERVQQTRKFGLDKVRLTYAARLVPDAS